ncbi:MAG: 3-methyl-2-oxobutanoate hydroxymethyltransferase [Pseudomonadota bacterium]
MSNPGLPVTIRTLKKMKAAGEKISCITAYDASFAAQVDAAQIDVTLVGDSLGMVVQGHGTPVPVTIDHIVYHCKAVARGLQRSLLMADMPFMSYSDPEQALRNAARLMQEGGAQMVKLEGGQLQVNVVENMTARGIPVCAHLGLTPQSVHKLGGFFVQGKQQDAADRMLEDALALEQAGADIVLLECVPDALAKRIWEAVSIPVIGIGAGPNVDGQILVLYDVLNVTSGKKPKFSKNYLTEGRDVLGALQAYNREVKEVLYPGVEHYG